MGKLDGKIALVTGSARGIGLAIARTFALEGATVLLNALHLEGAERAAHEIIDNGGRAIAIQADVSQKAEVQNLVHKILENYGTVHILVNNAGTNRPSPLLEITEEDWDIIQDINLKSVFLCTQRILPHMIKSNYGKIVNIASFAAFGAYNPTAAAYAAAKAGVITFTKYTAREAGPYGINVNCIAPGRVATELLYNRRTKEEVEKLLETSKKLTVLGRVGEPQDIANLALFLASDESSFITGQIIRSDGGRTDQI